MIPLTDNRYAAVNCTQNSSSSWHSPEDSSLEETHVFTEENLPNSDLLGTWTTSSAPNYFDYFNLDYWLDYFSLHYLTLTTWLWLLDFDYLTLTTWLWLLDFDYLAPALVLMRLWTTFIIVTSWLFSPLFSSSPRKTCTFPGTTRSSPRVLSNRIVALDVLGCLMFALTRGGDDHNALWYGIGE
jgi:hypothetical protein